jgi:hypothetical protein
MTKSKPKPKPPAPKGDPSGEYVCRLIESHSFESDFNLPGIPKGNFGSYSKIREVRVRRVFVDAFRTFTRPGLTWAMVLALVVFIMAGKVGPVAVEAVIADFVFTTSTAVMWWFGSRPMSRTK